ncbi:rhamnan synthesis F family protein [Microbacterium schleiferi]|uniref:rhamnan synthesis F family protein n=1 Tax=Microbacterium schleiferi TaxID=69362 RepID=UPI00311DEDDF
MKKRLVIVAHYDATGDAAPHVIRQLDALSMSFDRIIVATTSSLTPRGRQALASRAEVIERPNYGQDFASWRDGLERANWGRDYDSVLLTNDSYVGVINSYEPVISTMDTRPVEVWGLTKTWRHQEHIQSYFLYFTKPALRSQGFHGFWSDFRPAPNRQAAILTQEIGISSAMRKSGFRLGSYFEPTIGERRLANLRGVHWLVQRRRSFPEKFHNFSDHFSIRRWRDPFESNNLNWATDFADFVFDRARYPVVKFDTLRYDPHWLGSDRLLTDCEREFPLAFDGVRDYIRNTAEFYPSRVYENAGPAHLNPLARRMYGYRRQGKSGWKGN